MMRNVVLIFLVILNFCVQAQNNQYTPRHSVILDMSYGEQTLNQCSRGTPANISGYWTPSAEDIKHLELNFLRVTKLKARGNKTISSLDNFVIQYIGVLRDKKKFIYINAFYLVDPITEKWQTRPIVICDGGDYFWGVLFNPKTSQFLQLEFNGP